ARESLETPGESGARGAHPVGRWLSRMLGWGKREPQPAAPSPAPESEATPLSTYDSLLSESVAPPEPAHEQTHLELSSEEEATSLADLSPFEFTPEQSEFATEYATGFEPVAQAPVAESESPSLEPDPQPELVEPFVAAAPERVSGLQAAGLADVLGASFLPPAAEPEPEPEPEPPAFTHHDLLRALSESPLAAATAEPSAVSEPAPPTLVVGELRVDREPVGAAEDFAIPPVPGMAAPPVPVNEPIAAPPMLHVNLTPYTPEPLVAPVTAAASEPVASPLPPSLQPPPSPPTLRVPETPPVLHVSVPEAAAPPVLRVELPGETPAGPPVLRVEPLPAPPPVIVPTPPVSPVAPAAGFAPTFEPQPESANAEGAEAPAAPPRLPFPAFDELRLESRPWYRRPQVLGAIVVALFGAGWLLGALATPRNDEPNAFTRLMRAIGLGGARYEVAVDSSPTGAWIAVDGKDVAKRTPAKLELKPGKHVLTLTLPELGAATVEVSGRQGETVKIDPSLNGSLEILPADPTVPISVSLDGRPQGYAPITVESLAPGLHEVQFSGPGMAPWAQTIQVGVRKTEQLLARPMTAPGTGVLQVQATLNDETGSSPLSGAQVFVDGESRGATPLSLELARGPHSIRVVWHGETAPVQVIDLPGGNQRFASFSFGLDTPTPQITVPVSARTMSASQTNMISASFSQLSARDVREAWLHVRTAEGLWRRYAMTPVTGSGVTMMAAVFPPGMFDSSGRAVWYVSATSAQGDEYFSEMQPAYLEGARSAKPAKPAAPKPAETP
ncbi:MAG: PEGA domain-containing protein, partial [Candidatus Eisenbacteria bacterium]|nr:PEGA domain-containing protein [Candidatus Eisenbacteria bacterium]